MSLERSLREQFPRLTQDGGKARVRELEQLRALARRFADAHVRPRALEIDRRCGEDPRYFDWDLVRAGAEHGMLRILTPAPAGGTGGLGPHGPGGVEGVCGRRPGLAR